MLRPNMHWPSDTFIFGVLVLLALLAICDSLRDCAKHLKNIEAMLHSKIEPTPSDETEEE